MFLAQNMRTDSLRRIWNWSLSTRSLDSYEMIRTIAQCLLVKTYSSAAGKTSLALEERISGAGDPPKNRPSRGYPARELSMRSDTMAGTLNTRDKTINYNRNKILIPAGNADVFLSNQSAHSFLSRRVLISFT